MKTLSYALAFVCLLALPTMTLAKGKAGKSFDGKVTAVDTAAHTITVKNKMEEEKTFKANDATITVDGTNGKLSDIKAKMKVTVTAGKKDEATAIEATSHKKGDKKNKGGAGDTSAS